MVMDLEAIYRVQWRELDRGERAAWQAWYEIRHAGSRP